MDYTKPAHLREANLRLIKQTFLQNKLMTQKEVSQHTGLSVMTISKLIPHLLGSQFIREQNQQRVTGGRRSALYQLNSSDLLMAILQIREDKQQLMLFASVWTAEGVCIAHRPAVEEITAETILHELDALLLVFPAVKVIVMGIPGAQLKGELRIMDVESLRGLDFKQVLVNRYALQVSILNDVNAATVGYGSLHKEEIIAALYYPCNYPPGASLWIHGQLYLGSKGMSGEVKYLPNQNNDRDPNQSLSVSLLRDTMQTIISLYDPDQLIVYGSDERFSDEAFRNIFEAAVQQVKEVFSDLELPAMHVLTTFDSDYQSGLVQEGSRIILDMVQRGRI